MKTNQPLFAPKTTEIFPATKGDSSPVGDSRDGSVYVYSENIILAVRVALATNRPLLIRGAPGNGKSSLARNAARHLGWRYYEAVITSRTQARDLLWELDLLRRLSDANLRNKEIGEDLTPYIKPGIFWWAFDGESAERRGLPKESFDTQLRLSDPNRGGDDARAVVLIDEIDKADPDVPNNLLVPIGSLQFEVEETRTVVKTDASRAPLVFITTNGERELPPAFLRRCVDVELPDPTAERLVEIGRAHFPSQPESFLLEVADSINPTIPSEDAFPNGKLRIGVAEYLDTVRACIELKIKPGSKDWKSLLKMTVLKGRVMENPLAS